MKQLRTPAKAELYSKVALYRSQGMQAGEIARALRSEKSSKYVDITTKQVREALSFVVRRYQAALEQQGREALLAEQAMAIEVTMTVLSSLIKDTVRAEAKAQVIKLREDLRKDWMNLLAQAGMVKLRKASFFESVTEGMSEDEKRKLVKAGMRRIKQLQKEEGEQQARLPEGVKDEVGTTYH